MERKTLEQIQDKIAEKYGFYKDNIWEIMDSRHQIYHESLKEFHQQEIEFMQEEIDKYKALAGFRTCSDCSTTFKSENRCPECCPMG